MTPDEKRLRRKLGGLGTSQTRTRMALDGLGAGIHAQRLRAKLGRVTQEIEDLTSHLLLLEKQRTATDRMPWPVLLAVNLTRKEFVDFWDRHYAGYDEEFYQDNIGQPLTDERIRKWFEWKNGKALSPGKAKSILRYSASEERISDDADDAAQRTFLRRPGGAVWRIFWAHLQHPMQYPIYDQHVHRAMAFLRGWDDLAIPSDNASKVGTYLDEYRPFFREFKAFSQRRVDRALWAFGKFIASGYGGMLERKG